ncbi:MAG: hypothetical protein AB8G99_00500, partial [Planctomycetaceae bacterium]
LASDSARRIESAEQLRDELQQFTNESDLSALIAEYPNVEATDPPSVNSELVGVVAEVFPHRANTPPPVITTTNGAEPRSPSRWWLALLPILLGPLIYFGVTILLRTPDGGTVRIESQIDDVQLELVDEKDAVTKLQVTQSGKETGVKIGRYRVRIAGGSDGIQVSPNELVVKKGETAIARITQKPGTGNGANLNVNGDGSINTESGWISDGEMFGSTPENTAGQPSTPRSNLDEQLIQLRIRLAQARKQYGPRHPKVQELVEQVITISKLVSPPARSTVRRYRVPGSLKDAATKIEAHISGSVINEDMAANALHIKGTDSQHKLFESVISRLNTTSSQLAKSTVSSGQTLEVYTLRGDTNEVSKTIEVLMPGIIVNTTSTQIHALASESQHAALKSLLQKLDSPSAQASESVAAAKVLELRLQLDEARKTYGEGHSKVRELKSQLEIAEQLASGVPTEPVYKGKPLRHWEAILKYETLKTERVWASRAVVELMKGLRPERQLELLLLCFTADTTESRRWAKAKDTPNQIAVAKRFLSNLQLSPTTRGLITGRLNTPDTCENTVLMLTAARGHLKTDPQWKSVIDVAYAQRKHLPEESQVYLAEMLPDAQAVEYVKEFQAQLSGDALQVLTKAVMRKAIPLSREDLMHLAGRCFTAHATNDSISALFPQGAADSWTDQQNSDAVAYFKPIIASYQTHPSSTVLSFELEWIHEKTKLRQVPNALALEIAQLFTDSIHRNRQGRQPFGDLILQWARAVVLLTGKLPANLMASDPKVLPNDIGRMVNATRYDEFDLETLRSYPIETLERLAGLSREQFSFVFQKNSVVEAVDRLELSPALALAIVADETVPEAARLSVSQWLAEISRVGASEATTLRNEVDAHDELQALLTSWFDQDPSREAMLVISAAKPNERFTQNLMGELRAPISQRKYGLATNVLAYWSDQLETEDFAKAVQLADQAPARFFPNNHLASYATDAAQAVRFLQQLDDFKAKHESELKGLEPGTKAHKAAQGSYAEQIIVALKLVDRMPRNESVRELAGKLRSQVEDGHFKFPARPNRKAGNGYQKRTILELLEDIETGEPEQDVK